MEDNYFLKNLKKILEKYNQDEAADLLGVTPRSVSNYLTGTTPHQKTMRLAEEVVAKMASTKHKTSSLISSNNSNNQVNEAEEKFDLRELLTMITSQQETIRSQQETIKILVSKGDGANGRVAASA